MAFFDLIHTDAHSCARAGVVHTDHGDIQTPIFMPVGTVGTVKGVQRTFLEEDINAQIILGNTYHLYLRPGTEILHKAGGLHRFEGWTRPILTDSGGFQVFSLTDIRKMTEEGVQFSSHIDGRKLMFTPENVMDIQREIGADIIMAFDECAPYPADRRYVKDSLERTTRWLKRCKDAHQDVERQSLFGIMQGGMYKDLRKQSAEEIVDLDLPGYAIGGLSVGEPKEIMIDILDDCADLLPKEKPRYLMGVGTPDYLFEGVERGIDFFDCVYPSRNGRHGHVYTNQGKINLFNQKYEKDMRPIEEGCQCPACRRYSRAYIRHLFKAKEMLAMRLCVIHNLYFYNHLMEDIRQALDEGRFAQFKAEQEKILGNRI